MCSWIGKGFCSGQGPWCLRELDGFRNLVKVGNGHDPEACGVNRCRIHLGDNGRGVARPNVELMAWFQGLATRICCGDWSRVCGPAVTTHFGLTGLLLDPPYSASERCSELYRVDSGSIAADVREWAIANGSNPKLRICLCGYAGEHNMPSDWECVPWQGPPGYAVTNINNLNRHCQ